MANAGEAGALTGTGGAGGSVAPSILPETIPTAHLENPYAIQLSTQPGGEDHVYTLTNGSLPNGISLSRDGLLHGVPVETGEWSFAVRVSKSNSDIAAWAAYQLHVVRTRWLASVSSASSTTNINLIDLLDSDAAPILLEDQRGANLEYSPDGRWIAYFAHDSDSEISTLTTVNTAGAVPSEPIGVWEAPSPRYIYWSPDGDKLVCPRQVGDEEELLYTDMSGAVPGATVSLGVGPAVTTIGWASESTLVYGREGQTLVSQEWHGNSVGAPVSLGAPVGATYISKDGTRAHLYDENDDFWLVDLIGHDARRLPQHSWWSFDPSFSAAWGGEFPEEGITLTLDYYAVQGTELAGPVGQVEEDYKELGLPPYPAMFNYWSSDGPYRAEIREGRLAVVRVLSDGPVVQEVSGDYDVPKDMLFSPDGSWLYFTADETESGVVDHWVARVVDGEPRTARLVSAQVASDEARFSPNSHFLVISEQDGSAEEVASIQLLDLRDVEDPKARTLDVPLGWIQVSWPMDSTYLALIGGNPEEESRDLYLFDVLDEELTPKLITRCPGSGVSCPSYAKFQPVGVPPSSH